MRCSCLTWEWDSWAVTQRLKTVIVTVVSRPEQFLPLRQPHPRAVWFSEVPSLVLQPSLWSCVLSLRLLISSLLWVSWRPHNDRSCFYSTLGAAVDGITQEWGMERGHPERGWGEKPQRVIHKAGTVSSHQAGSTLLAKWLWTSLWASFHI